MHHWTVAEGGPFKNENFPVRYRSLVTMNFSAVAETYEEMGKTEKRLQLTSFLADLFRRTPKSIIDKVVYLMQGKLAPDFVGMEIGIADRLLIRAIALATERDQRHVTELYQKVGDLGTCVEELSRGRAQVTLFSEPLSVERVYDVLSRMARTSGIGAVGTKLKLLVNLINDSTPVEAKHILRTVTGKLRLGVADYTVLDALSLAYTGDKANRTVLEKAYNLSSDLGKVARTLAFEGLDGVRAFRIRVGNPIRPMLAERLETPDQIVEKLGGRCAAEYKLDGERLQIHKDRGEVQIFSRRLENITSHYPDVVELCTKLVRADETIMEAEAVALYEDTGEYMPFQELMHRRRKYGVEEAVKRYPITVNFFDLLYADGKEYVSEPYLTRRKALESIVVQNSRVKLIPVRIVDAAEEIEAFMNEAIAQSCEGLVVKDLDSVYRAGAREFAWIKLKKEYRTGLADTFDLVIVGVFHGRGRRAGRYGAFLLAAYDNEDNAYRTACKIGTGFSDEDLAKFPELLNPYLLSARHPRVDSKLKADVWLAPRVVIETIASGITLSPIHTCGIGAVRPGSGLGLRFPKFTGRIRDDKGPEDATTSQEIIEMYRLKHGRVEGRDELGIRPEPGRPSRTAPPGVPQDTFQG